jgi:MYXO-CTERM domain-containing protein
MAYIPVFDAHDVDLVFNGHSHDYERYAPSVGVDATFGGTGRTLPAGQGASLPNAVPDGATGTTYIVSGGAGALTTDIFGFTCLDAACTFCTGFNLNCPAEVFDNDQDATVTYDGQHNFAVVDVDGDTMTFEVRSTVAGNIGGGNVIEAFTMTKSTFDLDCDATLPPDAAMPDARTVTPPADAGGPGETGETGGCCDTGGAMPAPLAPLALVALGFGVLGRRRRR